VRVARQVRPVERRFEAALMRHGFRPDRLAGEFTVDLELTCCFMWARLNPARLLQRPFRRVHLVHAPTNWAYFL
jgi:hypothetical protein